jgi:hypothetical protein
MLFRYTNGVFPINFTINQTTKIITIILEKVNIMIKNKDNNNKVGYDKKVKIKSN